MSIQFRSRVKSVKDFGSDLKQIGLCCYTDGTSESLSFYECFTTNGTFLIGENIECPQQGQQGNCFACTYLTQAQKAQVIDDSSILDSNPTWGTATVTQCECARVGGVFHPTNPNNVNGRDARIPQSCCYFAYDTFGFPIGITCENVCSEKECSLKGITSNDGFLLNTPIYNASSTCLDNNCTQGNLTQFMYDQMASGKASTTTAKSGVCYKLTKSNDEFNYNCSLTFKPNCTGYWIPSDYKNNKNLLCDSLYTPTAPTIIEGRKLEPQFMSESQFNLLGLTTGDEYHGGIYIGKFIPNSATSKVYGSLNFSAATEKHYNETSPKGEYSKWALIVHKTNYFVPFHKKEEAQYINRTSLSDGFYNCYGNKLDFYGYKSSLLNSIVGQIRSGFADYYIPSIIELYYLANKLRTNSSLYTTLGINSKLFSSSFFFEDITTSKTLQSNFNGTSFIYGQELANNSSFGKTILVPTTSTSHLRLFRKVILT